MKFNYFSDIVIYIGYLHITRKKKHYELGKGQTIFHIELDIYFFVVPLNVIWPLNAWVLIFSSWVRMRERINLKSNISWPTNYIYCWMLAFWNIYMNKKTPYRVYVRFKRFSVIISICDVRFLDKALCNLHIRACMSECFIPFMHASVCAKSWSLHKINPSSKNVFIVLFSLHLNSFILFHSTQNISFGNYMGPKCVLWKFMSNHCWKRIYVRVLCWYSWNLILYWGKKKIYGLSE